MLKILRYRCELLRIVHNHEMTSPETTCQTEPNLPASSIILTIFLKGVRVIFDSRKY